MQSKGQEAGRVGHGEGEAAHAKKCAGHGSSRSISQDFRMLLPLVGPHKRTSRTWSAINVNVEIFMMQPPSAQCGTEWHREWQAAEGERHEGSAPPFLCDICV